MKKIWVSLCCLSALSAFLSLASLQANDEQKLQAETVEAKIAQKLAREQSEQEEFELAQEADFMEADSDNEFKNSLTHTAFFGTPTYTTSHTGAQHFATAVSGKGNHVFLEDGSGWLIAADDASKTLDWLGEDTILVIPAPWYSFYNFVLVNLNTGAHVKADLKERAFEINAYTLWISELDPEVGSLTLSDKTVWTIPGSYDRQVMKAWFAGQKVLIGINGSDGLINKWFSKKAPNLLISVEPGVDGYIKGRCEY